MDIDADELPFDVTPCVGVWIEIRLFRPWDTSIIVTPCVGVWIEIGQVCRTGDICGSLPAWECGLK